MRRGVDDVPRRALRHGTGRSVPHRLRKVARSRLVLERPAQPAYGLRGLRPVSPDVSDRIIDSRDKRGAVAGAGRACINDERRRTRNQLSELCRCWLCRNRYRHGGNRGKCSESLEFHCGVLGHLEKEARRSAPLLIVYPRREKTSRIPGGSRRPRASLVRDPTGRNLAASLSANLPPTTLVQGAEFTGPALLGVRVVKNAFSGRAQLTITLPETLPA